MSGTRIFLTYEENVFLLFSTDNFIRFGEEDNPDPVFHPCKGLFKTCCSLINDKPIINHIEKKEGCGHRNSEGVGFRITGQRDSEAQYGKHIKI